LETENQAAGGKRVNRIAPGKWVPALSKALGKHKFFRFLVYGAVIGALSRLMAASPYSQFLPYSFPAALNCFSMQLSD